jgi:hypothetical protein
VSSLGLENPLATEPGRDREFPLPQVVPVPTTAMGAEAAPRSRIVVTTQPRWLIQLEGPPAEPIARPGLGTCRRLRAHPQVGDGRRGRVRPQVARPVLAEGVASGPPHVGQWTGVVAERQLPCPARVPPHATLPGRGAPCVQLSGALVTGGDLRPGEASPPKPDDPLTDLLGYRPPKSHTPIVLLRLETGRPIIPAHPSGRHLVVMVVRSGRQPNHLFEQVRTGVLLPPSEPDDNHRAPSRLEPDTAGGTGVMSRDIVHRWRGREPRGEEDRRERQPRPTERRLPGHALHGARPRGRGQVRRPRRGRSTR